MEAHRARRSDIGNGVSDAEKDLREETGPRLVWFGFLMFDTA